MNKKEIFIAPIAAGFFLLLLMSFVQDMFLHINGISGASRIWILDVDAEMSIYTWASYCLIFLNAVFLFLIALKSSRKVLYWLILSCVFGVLSLDEALSFHERLSDPVKNHLNTTGVFYFAWVIPALAACAVGALAYIPFLRSLPGKTMIFFIFAAVIFLSGAIGIEMIGGFYAEKSGIDTFIYRMLAHIEEGLEGAGMIVFLYALLDYLDERGGGLFNRLT